MDCIFCKKEIKFEPVSPMYSNLIQIWRCIDCRAQFILHKGTNNISNLVFFRDIKGHPFSIQVVYPSLETSGNVTVRRHDGKFACTDNEVLELPFIEGLTPENAGRKLKTWLLFS